MKISVLIIIAHNEEKYIGECIESILNQTQKADEIVLIVHNSTDSTEGIARKYPIKVISFRGGVGPVYARLEGLKYVNGDIVLCLDGDAYAKNNWVEVMSRTLQNGNILVGSHIKMIGSFFIKISNIWNKYFREFNGIRNERWIWGASMAFWGKDKENVEKYFNEIINITKKLKLSRIPEDFYLAYMLNKEGNLEVVNTTFVTAYEKEKNIWMSILRNRENAKNGNLLTNYLMEKK